MNTPANNSKNSSTASARRNIAVAIIFTAVTMAVIVFLETALPRPAAPPALRETIDAIDRSAAREKTVINAVKELSRLASRGGYELAVNDIIRDHDADMTVIRKNAAVLKSMETRNASGMFLEAVLIAVAVQGLFLFIYFSRKTGRD